MGTGVRPSRGSRRPRMHGPALMPYPVRAIPSFKIPESFDVALLGSAGVTESNGATDFESGDQDSFTAGTHVTGMTGANDHWFSFWMNQESWFAFRCPWSQYDYFLNHRSFAFLIDGAGNLTWYLSSDGTSGTTTGLTWGSVLSTGTTYHVMAWYDYSATTMYLSVNNGTPVSVSHSGGIFAGNASTPMRVGARQQNTTVYDWFDGVLDSMAYGQTLPTEAERAQLYNSGAGLNWSEMGVTLQNKCDHFYSMHTGNTTMRDYAGSLNLTAVNSPVNTSAIGGSGYVSAWTDQNNGYVFFPPSIQTAPDYVATDTIGNGSPGIGFAGSQHLRGDSATKAAFAGGSSGRTIHVNYWADYVGTQEHAIWAERISGPASRVLYWIDNSGNPGARELSVRDVDGGSASTISSVETRYKDNVFTSETAVANLATGKGDIYGDGQWFAVNAALSNVTTGNFDTGTPSQVSIGALPEIPDRHFVGVIFSLHVSTKALTPTQVDRLENYTLENIFNWNNTLYLGNAGDSIMDDYGVIDGVTTGVEALDLASLGIDNVVSYDWAEGGDRLGASSNPSFKSFTGRMDEWYRVRQRKFPNNYGSRPILMFIGGINDFINESMNTEEEVEERLYAFINTWKNKFLIIASTPPRYFPSGTENTTWTDLAQHYRDNAVNYGAVSYVELSTPLDTYATHYEADGIHPSAAGVTIIEDAFIAAVETLLGL